MGPDPDVPMRSFVITVLAALAVALPLEGQEAPQPDVRRISVTWEEAPIRDVLRAFAAFSGRSIVAGEGVEGFVTADLNDQRWDVALGAVLGSLGLMAIEDEYGIIRVDDMRTASGREEVEPLVTRVYRISYSRASELQATIDALLSDRGSVSAVESNNTLVVTDVTRVQRTVAALLGRSP